MNLNDFQKNISLATYSIYKIGGPAEYFVDVDDNDKLTEILNYAQQNNILVNIIDDGRFVANDAGVKGLVVYKNNKIQSTETENIFKFISKTSQGSLFRSEYLIHFWDKLKVSYPLAAFPFFSARIFVEVYFFVFVKFFSL